MTELPSVETDCKGSVVVLLGMAAAQQGSGRRTVDGCEPRLPRTVELSHVWGNHHLFCVSCRHRQRPTPPAKARKEEQVPLPVINDFGHKFHARGSVSVRAALAVTPLPPPVGEYTKGARRRGGASHLIESDGVAPGHFPCDESPRTAHSFPPDAPPPPFAFRLHDPSLHCRCARQGGRGGVWGKRAADGVGLELLCVGGEGKDVGVGAGKGRRRRGIPNRVERKEGGRKGEATMENGRWMGRVKKVYTYSS